MHRSAFLALIVGLVAGTWLGARPAGAGIHITDALVEPTRLEPGERLELAVTATGGANFSLRHDRADDGPKIPGWLYRYAAPSYGFLPSDDFTEPGDYKNPESAHRDNGALDRDPRQGAFRLDLDTSDWQPGQYTFTISATNRPATGAYRGDARSFTITVAVPGSESAEPKEMVHLEVNGRRVSERGSTAPVFPGRPNRLTVRVNRTSDGAASWQVQLTRIQPDGRRTEQSVDLTPDSPQTTLDLGLLAVPAQFDFEAGVVYRRACRFRLVIAEAGGKPVYQTAFYHTMDDNRSGDVLCVDGAERVVHLGWPDAGSLRPLDPPVLMQLAPAVLEDVDSAAVLLRLRSEEMRLRPEWSLESLPGVVRVAREGEADSFWEQPVEIAAAPVRVALPAADWPEGRYCIELVPQVEGSDDHEGPVLIYRRDVPDADEVPLSPLAPWAFRRDRSRPELEIRDFRAALERFGGGLPDPAHWAFHDAGDNDVSLVTVSADWLAPGVSIDPKLAGHYAVFAEAEKGYGYVQVGREGLVRGMRDQPCLVTAADMTEQPVSFFPATVKGSGLKRVWFVPVTAESVAEVAQSTSRPPKTIFGVADWCDYFALPPSHHSAGGRVAIDQLDTLLGGHAELGIRHIGWSIGRSWVEYNTKLPQATRFPCVPLGTVPKFAAIYAGRAYMVENQSPLTHVLRERKRYGPEIHPWLAMQRHYGEDAYGGIFASQWFREHPQWRRWSKNGARSSSTVSYYFPEVRKERVDIFCEVAAKGPDGLLIGACRQPPMLLYHPEMVAEYRQRFGVDPQRIDASDEAEYAKWIRWRADFFTQTLRELNERLRPVRLETGRALPVAIRIPSKGLFYNMAQGLDVERWCREKLVDRILLDPLEEQEGRGEPHDVRPYLELGRRYGVTVLGGTNGNTFWNYTAILKRTLGLLEAGCAGIELYESNNFCSMEPRRWMIPMLGNPERIRQFLGDSNLDACYPVWSRNAAAGHDNHSFRGRWTVYGATGASL